MAVTATSKFVADLGSGLMLAQRFSPLTGRALAQSHVVVLASLAQSEFNEIFDSWEALRTAMDGFAEPEPEPERPGRDAADRRDELASEPVINMIKWLKK